MEPSVNVILATGLVLVALVLALVALVLAWRSGCACGGGEGGLDCVAGGGIPQDPDDALEERRRAGFRA